MGGQLPFSIIVNGVTLTKVYRIVKYTDGAYDDRERQARDGFSLTYSVVHRIMTPIIDSN